MEVGLDQRIGCMLSLTHFMKNLINIDCIDLEKKLPNERVIFAVNHELTWVLIKLVQKMDFGQDSPMSKLKSIHD